MTYLIWLQLALGAGNIRAIKALQYFKNAKNIYNADLKERIKSKVFTKNELLKLQNTKLTEAEQIVKVCKDNGIDMIAYGTKGYPHCLSVIDNPPLVLYVKGDFPDFDNIPAISIVGPRKVSDFGKKAAFSLAFRLASSGITVVSGGALGTDTYAHAGALKSGNRTALLMGCGILADYLKENANLRNAVCEKGCLISEFPPHTPAGKHTFPIRNRLIAALSLATVVIEAGKKSGALITAKYAYEQGRDVFVIPGMPNKKEYEGSNALFRDGAKPLIDASDIFNEYIVRFPDKINIEKAYKNRILPDKKPDTEKKTKNSEKNLNETLSKEAKIVYNYLDKQKFFPDDISGTELSPQQILSALTELEMEFLIRALPGGMYERC